MTAQLSFYANNQMQTMFYMNRQNEDADDDKEEKEEKIIFNLFLVLFQLLMESAFELISGWIFFPTPSRS